MNFSEYIKNRVFNDRPTAFAPQSRQTLAVPGAGPFGGKVLNTGTFIDENGDVTFGFYAPEASKVELVFGVDVKNLIPMTKDEEGVWTYILKWSPDFVGPKAFWFVVDGGEIASPFCSQYYSHSKAVNYVEIPDPNEDFVLMRDVPHGSVVTEYFWSHAQETWQRCLVYLPPCYFENQDEYPVLYLQHGAGENETSWIYDGRANHIMDNLLADGKAVPFIIVMNDGMARTAADKGFGGGNTIEKNIIDDCIPMIEKKYRVKKDQWSRGIAGFSMGSMQSCAIGLAHPEVFSYIGLLSGFMRIGRPTSGEGYPHLQPIYDKETFEKNCKLFYRGIGSKDVHLDSFLGDDDICREHGIDTYSNYVRFIAEGYPHDWGAMRILFHDFAVRLFR